MAGGAEGPGERHLAGARGRRLGGEEGRDVGGLGRVDEKLGLLAAAQVAVAGPAGMRGREGAERRKRRVRIAPQRRPFEGETAVGVGLGFRQRREARKVALAPGDGRRRQDRRRSGRRAEAEGVPDERRDVLGEGRGRDIHGDGRRRRGGLGIGRRGRGGAGGGFSRPAAVAVVPALEPGETALQEHRKVEPVGGLVGRLRLQFGDRRRLAELGRTVRLPRLAEPRVLERGGGDDGGDGGEKRGGRPNPHAKASFAARMERVC